MNDLAVGLCLLATAACSSGGGAAGPGAPDGAPPEDAAVVDGGAQDGGSHAEAAACVAPAIACDGACVVGSCGFAVTAIAPIATSGPPGAADWVNGGAFFAVTGHGFARGMRLFLGDGRAPVRVVDASHAFVQSPPAPAGAVDVRIQLGAQTGTTPGGFTYQSNRVDGTAPWEKRTMSGPHSDVPAVAVLADGRALVSGGLTGFSPYTFSATADLFSLQSGSTTATSGAMTTERWNHQIVALLGGKAAVLGAAGVNTYAGCDNLDVDLFDPAAGTFSKSGAPVEGLAGPRAVLLVDGRVLVLDYQTTSAEIFDPETGAFKALSGAPSIDYWQNNQGLQYLARLRDGRVLVVKGAHGDTYLFDPDTESFTKAGKGPLAGPDAVLTLPDGRVAAVGGTVTVGATSTASDRIELFDPAVGGDFAAAPYKLLAPRLASTAVLQRDGSILAIAGATAGFPYPYGCGNPAAEALTANVDRIDPVSGTVTPFAPLPDPNDYLVAATMRDGSAVVAGGGECGAAVAYPYLYFRPAPLTSQ